GIYIPSVEQQDDRGIIRVYGQCSKDQTRYKNRIKSWLDFHGVPVPADFENSHWSRRFLVWLKEIPLATESARISLDILIKGYEDARANVLLATRYVPCRETPVTRNRSGC